MSELINTPKVYNPDTDAYEDVPVFDSEGRVVREGIVLHLGKEGAARAVRYTPEPQPYRSHIVPLGVQLRAARQYEFDIPEGLTYSA